MEPTPEQLADIRNMLEVRFVRPPSKADLDKVVEHYLGFPVGRICGRRYGTADDFVAGLTALRARQERHR